MGLLHLDITSQYQFIIPKTNQRKSRDWETWSLFLSFINIDNTLLTHLSKKEQILISMDFLAFLRLNLHNKKDSRPLAASTIEFSFHHVGEAIPIHTRMHPVVDHRNKLHPLIRTQLSRYNNHDPPKKQQQ